MSPSPVFLNGTLNGGPVNVTVSVISTTGSITVSSPTVPWLTVNPQGSSPATITFTANPAAMAVGVYPASVTVSDPSGASVNVPVAFTVNQGGSTVSPSPATMVFSQAQGGSTPAQQPLSIVGNAAATAFSLATSTGWLTLSAASGATSPGNPGTVNVGVNPGAAGGPGVYTGYVTITPQGGTPVLVPVIFQITSTAQLQASVSTLAFNVSLAAPNTVVQKTISLTSTGGPISFGAVGSVLTTSGGFQWLSVTPQSATTPATLTVSVSAAGLPAGQYQGSVNIGANDASGASLKIPVNLLLSAQPLLDVSPTTLNFSYTAGGATPAHQFVTPTTTAPGQGYTVTTNTNGTGNWLQAVGGGATPAPVDVSVTPAGLGPGTYTGTVSITVPNAINSPQDVTVTLSVSNNPSLTSPSATAGLTFNYELSQAVPGPQSVSVNSTTGGPLAFTVNTTQVNTSNNVFWLLASNPSSSVTPATFSAAVNPAGLTAGRYTGAVVVTTPGGVPLSIPVTLNVTNAGSPLVNVNPNSVTFNTSGGGVNPQSVNVTSTGESIGYTVSVAVATPSGGTWLAVSSPPGPATSFAPSTFFITANPVGVPAGSYSGTVTVQPVNGNPGVVIPVTLNINSATLTVSPSTLNFAQTFGGAAPAQQTVSVTSTNASLPFTAVVNNASWLTVSPSSGTTPATLNVSVNGSALQPGNYSAQILVNATGAANGQQVVTVNLTVGTLQSLTASTASLAFTAPAGSASPPAQAVTLTATGGSVSFNTLVAVTAPLGGSWLTVVPASGTATGTPTTLTVSANPQGLGPGTYTGTITITSLNVSTSLTINVTFTVTAAPSPTPALVLNGASLQPGPIAPGEILTIRGTALGPDNAVGPLQSPGVILSTQVAGTIVTFDGIPAPITYLSSTSINVAVPYALAGRTQTQLVVSVNGVASSPIFLAVTDSAPGVFFLNNPAYPASQAMILNGDGTFNAPPNAAARGDIITILGTGEGTTTPPGVDGLVLPGDGSLAKTPLLQVAAAIGGQPANVIYAGTTPGLVTGIFQVVAQIPDGAPSGPTVGVTFSVGSRTSPAVATMAIQ